MADRAYALLSDSPGHQTVYCRTFSLKPFRVASLALGNWHLDNILAAELITNIAYNK